MVIVREDVCIEVCSELNDWMDCVFLVSKADKKKAVEILNNAWDDFLDDEDACYGEFLEQRMADAGIAYEVFYTANET